MSDVVERAKAALAGVTEGPWTVPPEDDPTETSATILQDGAPHRGILSCCDGFHYGYAAKANAEFIAAARTLVPELIAEVERLRWLWQHGDTDHMCDECWPQ